MNVMTKQTPLKPNKGRFVKTIYGRKWISNKDEQTENMWIVIIGLLFVVVMLLFK